MCCPLGGGDTGEKPTTRQFLAEWEDYVVKSEEKDPPLFTPE